MKELASEQTKVHYPSGHVDTIETAVLRAVRTGVGQASGNMAIEGMIEHDWDIILVSAHLGARYGDGGENPGNHFWWQGKFYSRTEAAISQRARRISLKTVDVLVVSGDKLRKILRYIK